MTVNGQYGPDAAKDLADQLRDLADRIEKEAADDRSLYQTVNYEMKRAHSNRYGRTGMLEGRDITHESYEIHISFHVPPAWRR